MWSVHAFVCLPLRKQCQAVGGQEKFQPMSSSSDREDLVDTAEPHSLLFCGHKKHPQCQTKNPPQSQKLAFQIFKFFLRKQLNMSSTLLRRRSLV